MIAFLHAANDHDVPAALALLHPEFQIHEKGAAGHLDRDEMEELLGWDAVIESEAHCESMEVDGQQVTGLFWETNALYQRLGMEATRCRLTFKVEDHSVRGQTIEQLDEGAFMAALEPFLIWAEEAASEEIAELQPGGEFVFSREMAGRWLVLLDRWIQETGGPDPDDAEADGSDSEGPGVGGAHT
ncbi:MAG: hypothetical protein R3E12_15020 [Candidatus Eisenbacteria bacterium]